MNYRKFVQERIGIFIVFTQEDYNEVVKIFESIGLTFNPFSNLSFNRVFCITLQINPWGGNRVFRDSYSYRSYYEREKEYSKFWDVDKLREESKDLPIKYEARKMGLL